MLGMGGSCCGCEPCDTYTVGFGGSYTTTGVTVGDTTDWTLDAGSVYYAGAGTDTLDWTVPVEVRSSPLVLRIIAEAMNASEVGAGVHITVNGTLVALTVDPDTQDVTLTYGSASTVVGSWGDDGDDLGLTITATECLTAIRWQVGDTAGTVRTAQVEFDPLDTSYVMGVDGFAAPIITGTLCEVSPLTITATGEVETFVDEACEEDPRHVTTSTESYSNAVGDIDCGGSPLWGENRNYWRGPIPLVVSDTPDPLENCDLVISCPVGGGSPQFQVLDSTGCDAASVTVTVDSSTSSSYRLHIDTSRTECQDGAGASLFVNLSWDDGGGTTGSRYDNVRMTACGTVPERDCEIVLPCTDVCSPITLPRVLTIVGPPDIELLYTSSAGNGCGANYDSGELADPGDISERYTAVVAFTVVDGACVYSIGVTYSIGGNITTVWGDSGTGSSLPASSVLDETFPTPSASTITVDTP